MATAARAGGLAALTYLGHLNVSGEVVNVPGAPRWAVRDNNNPDTMLEWVRGFVDEAEPVLFTVERDFNRNVAMYRWTAAGVLASWLLVPEDAEVETAEGEAEVQEDEMSIVEEVGYGVNPLGPHEFSINALPDEVFRVVTVNNQVRAQVTINGKLWVLRRILLLTQPRALGIPAVTEIHLDVETTQGGRAQFFYAVPQ